MMQACGVYGCDYVMEGYIEDFPVCGLHNARQTRQILEKLELPCCALSDDRPIVYPARIQLEEKHFEPRESRSGMRACDDPRMREVPGTPSRIIHPNFDLTAP